MKVAPIRPGATAHIAIVMHDFCTGGSERIAIRLANQWARSGWKVTILCGMIDGPARTLIGPQVMIVTVWPEIPRSLVSRIMLGLAFADCLAVLQPDIIFAPGNFHIPVLAALATRLGPRRPPIVCKLSNSIGIKGNGFLHRLMAHGLRRLTTFIDVFIAMSAALRDEAAMTLGRAEISVIHEPNVDGYECMAPNENDGSPLTIVCAGRLVAQKNFSLAIRAFGQVASTTNARLMLLGEGKLRADLEQEADGLGLRDRIIFCGHVTDIRPALRNASLFLLCSRYEGYPAVLVEALAAGVPIVATDCSPAIREIICHRSFGQTVAQDEASIARAIKAVLKAGRPDPERVAAFVQRHRLDYAAGEYLALFSLVMESRTLKPQKSQSAEMDKLAFWSRPRQLADRLPKF